jgi:non-heme chloroperoxidase
MMGSEMEGFIHTADDVSLRYTTRGAGQPVVFVHGWLGAAEQWHPSAQALAGQCRAIAYDQRGHGRSDDARSGWTVHRLAHDLAQLLDQLAMTGAVLVGHSMGCSVIWAYLELFGAARLERLVLVDQAPAMVVDPVWDERTIGRAGATFTDRELHALCHSLADPESREQTVRAIVGGMLTPTAPPALKERAVAWGMRVDGAFAAALLRNHAHQDWRRQIGLINIPTLVVAGRASVVPWTAAEWIAHKIRGARLDIFEPDEGGSHLLALENPARFNRLLSEFVVAGAPNTTDPRPSPVNPTPPPPIESEGATI